MKILVYIYEEMADFEISMLLQRLHNTGKCEITSVCETMGPVMAQSGLYYVPNFTIDELDLNTLDQYEALLIPGGPVNNDQNAICPVVKKMVELGKLVGAICFGPQFLGRAGVLKDYKFTTSCSADKIQLLGVEDPYYRPNYVAARTCVDRNVITGQGYALVDFAGEICKYLGIFKDDAQTYEMIGRLKDDIFS